VYGGGSAYTKLPSRFSSHIEKFKGAISNWAKEFSGM
jgi:hypothetical protein